MGKDRKRPAIGTVTSETRHSRVDTLTAGGGWNDSPPRVGIWAELIGRLVSLLRSARPSRATEGLGPVTSQQPARPGRVLPPGAMEVTSMPRNHMSRPASG